MALPVIAGATVLKGSRLRRRGLPAGALAPFAVGAGRVVRLDARLTWLIRQVERDRSLLPYALYRIGLAAVVIERLHRTRSA